MNSRKDGFLYAYSIKETPNKGRGVFAAEPIKEGSLVWRHVPGQYAVYNEISFNALIAKMTPDQVIYELTHVFGLADFPNCLIRVFDAGVLFNHASNANLMTNNTPDNPAPLDPGAPGYLDDVAAALLGDRYAMIATRDIEAGEEFTNNYLLEESDPPFFEAIYDQYDIDDSYLEADDEASRNRN